jgi:hypothetical protein
MADLCGDGMHSGRSVNFVRILEWESRKRRNGGGPGTGIVFSSVFPDSSPTLAPVLVPVPVPAAQAAVVVLQAARIFAHPDNAN